MLTESEMKISHNNSVNGNSSGNGKSEETERKGKLKTHTYLMKFSSGNGIIYVPILTKSKKLSKKHIFISSSRQQYNTGSNKIIKKTKDNNKNNDQLHDMVIWHKNCPGVDNHQQTSAFASSTSYQHHHS